MNQLKALQDILGEWIDECTPRAKLMQGGCVKIEWVASEVTEHGNVAEALNYVKQHVLEDHSRLMAMIETLENEVSETITR